MSSFIHGLIRKFLALKDTPDSFSGKSGQYCRVNDSEDGLEFVVIEGDYDAWIPKWVAKTLPDGLQSSTNIEWFIDEVNKVVHIGYVDTTPFSRYGIFDISDFSTLFIHPSTSSDNHFNANPDIGNISATNLGNVDLTQALSRALQTYVLLINSKAAQSIAVYRGASLLWRRYCWYDDVDISGFSGAIKAGGISIGGKYILIAYRGNIGTFKLMLYAGATTQDSGTATGVTETTITDSSKSWVVDEHIGSWISIGYDNADWNVYVITGNTATEITCAGAKFITDDGMPVGEIYKIVEEVP